MGCINSDVSTEMTKVFSDLIMLNGYQDP